MLLAELLDYILTENKWDTSLTFCPSIDVIRVSPQQVTKKTRVWHILRALHCVDLGQEVQLGGQATMHAQDSLVDDSWDWEVVEHGAEFTPHREIVSSFAFVVEAIHSCDWIALVISSQQEYPVRVFHLVSKQKSDRLDALFASVDEVTDQAELVLRRWSSNCLKKS